MGFWSLPRVGGDFFMEKFGSYGGISYLCRRNQLSTVYGSIRNYYIYRGGINIHIL